MVGRHKFFLFLCEVDDIVRQHYAIDSFLVLSKCVQVPFFRVLIAYLCKEWWVNSFLFYTWKGWTGLFCPCVLFGRNIESLRDDTPWTTPCVCHAVCVEGGIALAAATALFHGIDPNTSFLFCEGLLFAWWMCGIYTGLVRQSLQKKYHLKVTIIFSIFRFMLWIKDSKDPWHIFKVKKSITCTFCRCRQDGCFWFLLYFMGAVNN